MIESGYYPPGAEFDSRAPYNQIESEPIDKEVCISITLSKNTTLSIRDYNEEVYDEWETDDDGNKFHIRDVDYDFSNCNLLEAYKKQEFTISQLLGILKEYATADAQGSFHTEGSKASFIQTACDEWIVDEEEVILN